MRTKKHLVHACLHKIYLRVFFEQEVLRVLAELNTIEIARIVCARITTGDFHSSSNRAVQYKLTMFTIAKLAIPRGIAILCDLCELFTHGGEFFLPI